MKLFKHYSLLFTVLFAFAVFLNGCEDYNDLDLQDSGSNQIDLSNYVAVGNSLTAGFQNNALYRDAQEYSFPALLAERMQIEDFEQPLISNPGLSTEGRIEVTNLQTNETTINANQGEPINTKLGRPFNNLGIPGAQLADYLNSDNSLNDRQLYPVIVNQGNPQTPMQSVHAAVQALQPTVVTFWLGNNDILNYVTSGGLQEFTNPAEFQQEYSEAITALKSISSGPTVLTPNIPAVSALPFATRVGPTFKEQISNNDQVPGLVVQKSFYEANQQIGASENQEPAALIPQSNLDNPSKALVLLTARDYLSIVGVSANTQASSYDAEAVQQILGYWRNFLVSAGLATQQEAQNMNQNQLEQALTDMTVAQFEQTFGTAAATQFASQYPGFEFDKPFGLDPQNPFPNQFVLDQNEISIANTVTGIYNNVIAQAGDATVDINSLFDSIINQGFYEGPVSSEKLTPSMGSMFSLDGIHPTNKGQVIIANEIIKVLNNEDTFNANIPKVDLRRVPSKTPIASN